MKKFLISMMVVAVVVPGVAFASIDANLKYGSRGGEVIELQEFLIDKGFLTGQASGNFFALTRKAVIAWQASVGLPATGFVGSMSRAKINDELSAANAPAVAAEQKETAATTTTAAASSSANKILTLPNGATVEVDAKGNVVRFVTNQTVQLTTISSGVSTVTQSVAPNSSNTNQDILVEGCPQSQCGISNPYTIIGGSRSIISAFILKNPLSEDVKLTQLYIKIDQEFAKNLNDGPVNIEFQFPIDDFGVSKTTGVSSDTLPAACILKSLGGGQSRRDCDEQKLESYKQIAFSIPDDSVVVPANKSVRVFIKTVIAPTLNGYDRANSVAGTYTSASAIRACSGVGLKSSVKLSCDKYLEGGDVTIFKQQ